MKVIPREAKRITYSTEIRNLKKRLKLSDFQRSVVIGSLLGDGCLCENWSKTNFRFKVEHSPKQSAYVVWKYRALSEWVLTKPRMTKTSVGFRTVSHPEFTELRKAFYKNSTKVVPRQIDEFLKKPLIMAVWFMDDGNAIFRNGRVYGYHLNTQSFTKAENERLAKSLKRIYAIEANLEKNHGKWRLRIMKEGSRSRFVKLIKKFIVKDLSYKIS